MSIITTLLVEHIINQGYPVNCRNNGVVVARFEGDPQPICIYARKSTVPVGEPPALSSLIAIIIIDKSNLSVLTNDRWKEPVHIDNCDPELFTKITELLAEAN